ncbi:hypothetical protein AGLY_009816 [Aphis glycines]|uniref:Uncharacterized protein n=1 Tax=Aphis glycines TaxID=307491 RepID=A0A6G0TI75_APHGL|nr:hypothetical protein AGLY_009816 [Aphis glycines]
MNLPPLKVKQDVTTRWNSSFIMMERLVNIKAPLFATILYSYFKAISNKAAELSGKKYPTLSVVIPLIRGLQHILRNLKTKTDIEDVFRNMLMDIFSRRLGILEKNKIVTKATFLDPRFKKTAFGLLENASNAQKWVSEKLTMMINTNTEMENEINPTESTTALTLNNTNNTTESLWEHFDKKVAQVKTTSSPNITSTLIIRQYLEMTLLDPHKERMCKSTKRKQFLEELKMLGYIETDQLIEPHMTMSPQNVPCTSTSNNNYIYTELNSEFTITPPELII